MSRSSDSIAGFARGLFRLWSSTAFRGPAPLPDSPHDAGKHCSVDQTLPVSVRFSVHSGPRFERHDIHTQPAHPASLFPRSAAPKTPDALRLPPPRHPSGNHTLMPPAQARAGHRAAARLRRSVFSRPILPSVLRCNYKTRQPSQIVYDPPIWRLFLLVHKVHTLPHENQQARKTRPADSSHSRR